MGTLSQPALKLYASTFWMQLMGGPCPKRTLLVSNSERVNRLRTGKLVKGLHTSSVKTTEKYVDGSGRVRFKGTGQLKSTQTLVSMVSLLCW